MTELTSNGGGSPSPCPPLWVLTLIYITSLTIPMYLAFHLLASLVPRPALSLPRSRPRGRPPPPLTALQARRPDHDRLEEDVPRLH